MNSCETTSCSSYKLPIKIAWCREGSQGKCCCFKTSKLFWISSHKAYFYLYSLSNHVRKKQMVKPWKITQEVRSITPSTFSYQLSEQPKHLKRLTLGDVCRGWFVRRHPCYRVRALIYRRRCSLSHHLRWKQNDSWWKRGYLSCWKTDIRQSALISVHDSVYDVDV